MHIRVTVHMLLMLNTKNKFNLIMVFKLALKEKMQVSRRTPFTSESDKRKRKKRKKREGKRKKP